MTGSADHWAGARAQNGPSQQDSASAAWRQQNLGGGLVGGLNTLMIAHRVAHILTWQGGDQCVGGMRVFASVEGAERARDLLKAVNINADITSMEML